MISTIPDWNNLRKTNKRGHLSENKLLGEKESKTNKIHLYKDNTIEIVNNILPEIWTKLNNWNFFRVTTAAALKRPQKTCV